MKERSYHGQPIVAKPVWTWEVPAYFFTGGLAAGASMLAAGAAATGNASLARRARVVAAVGAATGTALLVSDLGRPTRFHHMLRVAKPTSPMSVGSWTLAAFATSAAVAAGADLTGVGRRLGRAAGALAAGLAPVLATYPAVLVEDTAVPVWHEAHRELPFVFAGGALASAGAVGAMLETVDAGRPARRMALLGAVLESVATRRMERALPEPVAQPYKTGRSAILGKAAQGCTAAGAAMLALRGRRRRGAIAGGAMILAGAALARFAVVEAGRSSSRDPKQVIVPQRARVSAEAGADGS